MCNYIETISGRKIDFHDPDPDQIVIEDIVHALRNTCRFGGFVKEFYSVMQHSANVALLVPDRFKYQAILHDAAEAYIGDMPTPFKYAMKEYLDLESRIQAAINSKFGLPDNMPSIIKMADRVALMTERDRLKPDGTVWEDKYEDTIRVPSSTFEWGLGSGDYYCGLIARYKELQ